MSRASRPLGGPPQPHQCWLPLFLGMAGPLPPLETPELASSPDAAGGVILLEVLYPQTLPSLGFMPPVPMLIHHTFSPGPGLFTSNPGSRACFHLRDPLASEEGALGFSGCFLFSCVTPTPPPVLGRSRERVLSLPLLS